MVIYRVQLYGQCGWIEVGTGKIKLSLSTSGEWDLLPLPWESEQPDKGALGFSVEDE
jgi:hypothetical protein